MHATEMVILMEDVQNLEDWSAESPNFNIIESLCWKVKKQVFQRKPHNLKALYGQEEWREITMSRSGLCHIQCHIEMGQLFASKPATLITYALTLCTFYNNKEKHFH